jgi:RNA ligase (TIGR02306 family)
MLASVQKIISVEPIANADALEKVKVLGWNVVAKKGEFKPGDLCVYIEIDSIVPDRPEFEFLRNKDFRIKTIRLRGEVSQGIVFPVNSFLSIEEYAQLPRLDEGLDVTDIIGVKKYEKPISPAMRGVIRGNFPGYVPKTDETRIQAEPRLLCEMKGIMCYSTVKMDGTSATYVFKDGEYHVCSRNMDFKLIEENKGNIYIEMGVKYGLEEKMKKLGRNIAIQGEICGPSIQKNRVGLKEIDLFVFNIYDIDNARYMGLSEMSDIVTLFDLKNVPLVEGFMFDYKTIEELLIAAKGLYSGTKNRREGIVIRPIVEQYSTVLKGRMSFKVVDNEYLLKDEE